MKILSFGHIPCWAGGRQDSGLANVIYQLARYMSNMSQVDMSLAATDVFEPYLKVGNLAIYGWTKAGLLVYSIMHPILSFKWMCLTIKAKINYPSLLSLIGFFFKGLHLAKTLTNINPDVVHLHGAIYTLYLPLIPKSTKVVMTLHGMVGGDPEITDSKTFQKLELNAIKSERINKLFFIASALISDFSDLYGNIVPPCEVILNAYDGESFYYIEPLLHEKLAICTIASMQPRKGQKRVLEGLKISDVEADYYCIGGGVDSDLREIIEYSKVNNVPLNYLGVKSPSQIREILSRVDFMILPSSSEGFGLVYLETIACGVPVILPKHLPIVQEKSIIKPGVNAVLIDDSSSASIARILPQLSQMQFNRKKVSESIIEYSWSGIAEQYVASIRTIFNQDFK